MARAQVMDISAYQPAIDWAKVKASGMVDGVWARATIGLEKDVMFEAHMSGAASQQIPQGGYHFLMLRPSVSEQVKRFCDRVADLTLPPMLDVEQDGGLTSAAMLEIVRSAIATCVAQLGVKPLLYTYPGFWQSLGSDGQAAEWAQLDLWIAHYTLGAPIVPKPWTTWRLHQWAASDPQGPLGRVDGVTGYVDRNYFNGTREEFRAWYEAQ